MHADQHHITFDAETPVTTTPGKEAGQRPVRISHRQAHCEDVLQHVLIRICYFIFTFDLYFIYMYILVVVSFVCVASTCPHVLPTPCAGTACPLRSVSCE